MILEEQLQQIEKNVNVIWKKIYEDNEFYAITNENIYVKTNADLYNNPEGEKSDIFEIVDELLPYINDFVQISDKFLFSFPLKNISQIKIHRIKKWKKLFYEVYFRVISKNPQKLLSLIINRDWKRGFANHGLFWFNGVSKNDVDEIIKIITRINPNVLIDNAEIGSLPY